MRVILIRGLIVGFVNLIVGLVFNAAAGFLIPSLAAEYKSGLFRPWTDPLMMAFFLYPFIVGIVLAYYWGKLGKIAEGKTVAEKAWNFALFYFVVTTIPGMFITYTSFNVSALMVISWTLMGLIEAYVAGYLLARRKA